MQIILLEKIANVGNLGDVVKVKEGYARNYLIPHGKAKRATPDNLAAFEARRGELEAAQNDALAKAQAAGSKIDGLTVQVSRKAGVDGRLFGSVTSSDVAAAVEAQSGVALDRKKLHVDHIKTTGTYQVAAKLHHDVEFPITVEVVAK